MIKKLKKLIKPLVYDVIHFGGKFKCTVCGHRSKAFREAGIIPRKDARCPFCGAVERHRLFWQYIKTQTDLETNPPKRALHVAPKEGLENKLRPLIGEGYITADLFDPRADIKMDITDIQFPDNSYDFIYCSHVLEHVPDDRKAMREFYRVLSDDGFAVLIVPIYPEPTIEDPTIEDPKERLRLFGQDDHVRKYGPDFADRLKEAGFKVQAIAKTDLLSTEEIKTTGLSYWDGRIYICKK